MKKKYNDVTINIYPEVIPMVIFCIVIVVIMFIPRKEITIENDNKCPDCINRCECNYQEEPECAWNYSVINWDSYYYINYTKPSSPWPNWTVPLTNYTDPLSNQTFINISWPKSNIYFINYSLTWQCDVCWRLP